MKNTNKLKDLKKDYIGFGGMLALKRRALNITQIDLAKTMGISQSLVSKIEDNQIIVDFPTGVKWLSFLKIDIDAAINELDL